jgi:hypothetical protein
MEPNTMGALRMGLSQVLANYSIIKELYMKDVLIMAKYMVKQVRKC